MELRDLQKMTVIKLRDEAMQRTQLVGVNAMSKDELIKALAPLFGIDLEAATKAARERRITDKATLKKAIRASKAERDTALKAHDATATRQARLGIKKHKRAVRRLVRQGATA
jgi:2-oxo-4-hydroxy-4-carboxy--5-ureidoimidazoline (OHCU) decarboxylase